MEWRKASRKAPELKAELPSDIANHDPEGHLRVHRQLDPDLSHPLLGHCPGLSRDQGFPEAHLGVPVVVLLAPSSFDHFTVMKLLGTPSTS
jgi:hypothetical protein